MLARAYWTMVALALLSWTDSLAMRWPGAPSALPTWRALFTTKTPPTRPGFPAGPMLITQTTVGIPRETADDERRVGLVPSAVAKLRGMGFQVAVERGAGELSFFPDRAFVEAGATLVSAEQAWLADVVTKVRPPSPSEAARCSALVLCLTPTAAVERAILAQGGQVLAVDRIARTPDTQLFDTLTSQAEVTGYRALIEALHALPREALGAVAARVLVYGLGVAGLSALRTAQQLAMPALGYDPRARRQLRELVERRGAVYLPPAGPGEEGAVLRTVARSCDVLIVSADWPAVYTAVVPAMKAGSVVVDLTGQLAFQHWDAHGRVDDAGMVDRVFNSASSRFSDNLCGIIGEVLVHNITHLQLDRCRQEVRTMLGQELPFGPDHGLDLVSCPTSL